MISFAARSLAAAVLVAAAGCGGGGRELPDTVPVSGTIYLNGQPLEGAEVQFFTEEFVAVGITGPDGRYELAQGAVPGENRVLVKKLEGEGIGMGDPAETGLDPYQFEVAAEAAGNSAAAKKIAQQTIPAHYSDPEKSKLTFPVPDAGTDKADFRLTSQ